MHKNSNMITKFVVCLLLSLENRISNVSDPYLLITKQLYVPKCCDRFSSMRSVDLMPSGRYSSRSENPKSLSRSMRIPLKAQETCFAFGIEKATHSISYVCSSNGNCSAGERILGGPFRMTSASALISGKPMLCALQ